MNDATMLLWIDRGRTLSYLLVAVGVVGEFFVDRISGPIIKRRDAVQQAEIARLSKDTADANARAAEANQKAEEERLARVKLEERIAARTLSPEQQSRISAKLKVFKLERADISWYPDSFEATIFASQIEAALKAAGWLADGRPNDALVNGMPIVSGVLIMTGPNDKSVEVGAALLKALLHEGVAATSVPLVQYFPSFAKGADPHSNDPYATRVLIVVGNHP
jgi:hypothetical protein